MKRIVLVRHGESEGNAKGLFTGWLDVPLTEKGKTQALALSEKIKAETFDRVISSDLCRSVETARLTWGERKPDIELDERLREKHFGNLEGMKFDEICIQFPEVVDAWKHNDYNFPIPKGESFQKFYDRIIKRYKELKQEDDESLLIFAHSGVIQAILAHEIVGSIKGCWRFKIENCKLVTLEVNDEYTYIKQLNV